MNADVKITVLDRTVRKDFMSEHLARGWPACDRFHDQQEFVSQGAGMPAAFCSWAWTDIHKYVLTLARGGDFIGIQPGVFVACCTDGFRPVHFLLERVSP